MTKRQKQKREYNRRTLQRMRERGWRCLNYYLPPDVYADVIAFKNQRLKEWRDAQPPGQVECEHPGHAERN